MLSKTFRTDLAVRQMVEAPTELRIAHISDLHFTSAMSWSARDENDPTIARLTALKQDLSKQKPHALMVTGDIADNTTWELSANLLDKAWQNALEFLNDVCDTLFPDEEDHTDKLFVIPGNHDAKILGNIKREELLQIVNHRAFKASRYMLAKTTQHLLRKCELAEYYQQISPIFDLKLSQAIESIPSDSKRFANLFGPYMQSRRVAGQGMFAFCVDSNMPNDSCLNFAQGAVSSGEATRLLQDRDRLQKESDYEHAYKLALVHHHPMPVPLAESGENRFEGDQFHLMRNAGSFMKLCVELGVDFILHGHQHVTGCSVVEFPRSDVEDESGVPRRIAVLGAASVQHAQRGGMCSYNLIRLLPNHECRVEVRTRPYHTITPYGRSHSIALLSPQDYRKRIADAAKFDVTVDRLDVFATIDSNGSLTTDYFAKNIRPANRDQRVENYPFYFMNESARATLVARGFRDTNEAANFIEGAIEFKTPATQDNPQDLHWGIDGAGLYTFSKEYCRWHKGSEQEQLGFRIVKRIKELYLDVEFPEDQPIDPRAEAIRILTKGTTNIDDPAGIHKLLAEGQAFVDPVETAICLESLRISPYNRATLHVTNPLPNVFYRIVWKLPDDEYGVLPDDDDRDAPNRLLRSRIRGVIQGLHDRCRHLDTATQERNSVHKFLEDCARRIALNYDNLREPFRIDLAIIAADGVIKVIAAGLLKETQYVESPLRPQCKLGETLRGKAYLQRAVLYYSPGIPDSKKDPNRDAVEKQTKHQISFPLVYPPELPYFPRVGVVTISSEAETSFLFKLQPSTEVYNVVQILHEKLNDLVSELGIPFPTYVAGQQG